MNKQKVAKDYFRALLTDLENGVLLTNLEKEALSALRAFIKAAPCQNGCKPDDMTCATMRAKAVLRKARGRR